MGMRHVGWVGLALVVTGCARWQKGQVRSAVVDALACPPEHAVAKGPYAPATEDGPVELGEDEQLFRGACSVAWDERVIVICDRSTRECRVVDVGPPRMKPRSSQGLAKAPRAAR